MGNLRCSSLEFCEDYVFGKHHRCAFGVKTHCSNKLLGYIHSDVWGPSSTAPHFGCTYYVLFIDLPPELYQF